ncbi:hypothetical protein ACET3Z_026338 [Daucus carota]
MNMVEQSIDFLSLNYGEGFKRGKLKLPLPFFVTFEESLPTDLVLHGPLDDLWPCTYRKGDNRIHGLEDWMDYYKVKPYNIVRLHYLDGPDFRFEIFTQYAVEMSYNSVISEIASKNCVYEVDKLCSKYLFNGFRNCVGKYSLVIDSNHLVEESYPKLLFNEASEKLGLDKSSNSILLGFEDHQWSISLKWDNDLVQFGREWVKFLKEAAICVGDLIILHRNRNTHYFKVAVFDSKIVSEIEQSGADDDVDNDFRFRIVLKKSHVDHRGHGAYIPPSFWTPSRQWDERTEVELVVGDNAWEVKVLRFGNQARFAQGWNAFVSENDLAGGSTLSFHYVGEFSKLNMDPAVEIPLRFLKVVIPPCHGGSANRMDLPRCFVEDFGNVLRERVTILLPNRERVEMRFCQEEGCLYGLEQLLLRFRWKDFPFLLFELKGDDAFVVRLVDNRGSVDDGISRFSKTFSSSSSKWDEVKIPARILFQIYSILPRQIYYRLNDNRLVEGSFDPSTGSLIGLQNVLRIYYMARYENLVFTYYGGDTFDISAYSFDCMEKYLNTNPLGRVPSIEFFEIEVQRSHLQQYDMGVTVSRKFASMTNHWSALQKICVLHGGNVYNLLIRKRESRCEIHRGWCDLCKELELNSGDICVFYTSGSKFRFKLEVTLLEDNKFIYLKIMASSEAANQAAKRKRFQDMKNNFVDEIYNLVIASDAFVTEVETASEDFSSIFQKMEKRQTDLINQAVLINGRYGSIADLVEEKKKPKIGETSSSFQTLPMSYSKSMDRFLHDSERSLQKHAEKTNKAVYGLINKFNESVETWTKKCEELKDQAEVLANNRAQHRVKVNQFTSVLYGYIPGIDSSDSDEPA